MTIWWVFPLSLISVVSTALCMFPLRAKLILEIFRAIFSLVGAHGRLTELAFSRFYYYYYYFILRVCGQSFLHNRGKAEIICLDAKYRQRNSKPRGKDSHMKGAGIFVVPLRGVNFRFWSRIGCSGSFRVALEEILIQFIFSIRFIYSIHVIKV